MHGSLENAARVIRRDISAWFTRHADKRKGTRDRFVLSKGHASPALYEVLAHCGLFDKKYYAAFRSACGMLQGHTDMKTVSGVDLMSGSLGHGTGGKV